MRTILFVLMLCVGSFASAQTTSQPCDEYTALRLDRIESDIVELRKLISERCPNVAKSSACNCNPCLCVNCTCKSPAAATNTRPTITCRGTRDATADWRAHEMQALFSKGYDVNFEIDNKSPLRYAYSWKPGETRGYLASLELPDVNSASVSTARSYTPPAQTQAPPIRDSPSPITVIPTVIPSAIVTPMTNECYIDATGKRICPNASQPVINRSTPIYSNRFFRR